MRAWIQGGDAEENRGRETRRGPDGNAGTGRGNGNTGAKRGTAMLGRERRNGNMGIYRNAGTRDWAGPRGQERRVDADAEPGQEHTSEARTQGGDGNARWEQEGGVGTGMRSGNQNMEREWEGRQERECRARAGKQGGNGKAGWERESRAGAGKQSGSGKAGQERESRRERESRAGMGTQGRNRNAIVAEL